MTTCALLTEIRHDWAAALTTMCPGLTFVVPTASALGVSNSPNPFALPESDSPDVVLVSAYWCNWLARNHPERVDETLRRLERLSGCLVGLDGADHFELLFSPALLERLALVLKFQGLFRDRELYNFDVGPLYPGAIWASRSRPKRTRYRSEDLDKLRLSLSSLMLEVPATHAHSRRYESGLARVGGRRMSLLDRLLRNRVEALFAHATRVAAHAPRPLDVHLIATLSHVQRLEALEQLDGLSGHRGIDVVPHSVFGLGPPHKPLPEDVRRGLMERARPYMRPRLGRLSYVLDLCRHKVGVAPTGYGELGQRHATTLMAGAALVCQDVSHVETMFELRDHENAVFCRHDLSDLRDRVTELLADDAMRITIARRGQHMFHEWAGRWQEHLRAGIQAHIAAAV